MISQGSRDEMIAAFITMVKVNIYSFYTLRKREYFVLVYIPNLR